MLVLPGPEGLIELIIALLLILLNGLFALSELAVVSARRPRLRSLAEQGRSGAQAALRLAEEPGRFLSTVQIGITLVGILAGAFSGAALSQRFDAMLEGWGVSTRVAEPLAYVIVIGAITYLSVIIGELVPKHVALRNPEGIACAVAPMMAMVSRVASPAVWFLDTSTKAIFKIFGHEGERENAVTDEEIRTLVAEAESAGVIEPEAIRQSLPPFAVRGTAVRNGVLEVVIDETGSVESAAMVEPLDPAHNRIILEAAKAWAYRPARLDGTPVKFRKRIQINLNPGN